MAWLLCGICTLLLVILQVSVQQMRALTRQQQRPVSQPWTA